ncbi:hypothetical protein [Muricoccus radiodurans]|uniref:hypothetical protein n=1 Tax=Muricoccus radiodurans TaxID=2231721 RepID=UPI003CF33570
MENFDADWFVRIVPRDEDEMEATLGRLFGQPVTPAGRGDVLRLQLIEADLLAVRAHMAALTAEAAALRVWAVEAEARAAAHASAADGSSPLPSSPPQPHTLPAVAKPARRLQEEVETVLRTLLPGVRLLRDVIIAACGEYRERGALYRAMRELVEWSDRLPPAWKRLPGMANWWERHVSTGDDDAGRAYPRRDGSGRGWEVLLSHKGQQDRDIAWLRRLA